MNGAICRILLVTLGNVSTVGVAYFCYYVRVVAIITTTLAPSADWELLVSTCYAQQTVSCCSGQRDADRSACGLDPLQFVD